MGSTEQANGAGGEIIYRSKLPDIAINNTLPLHVYLLERLPQVADRPAIIDGASGAIYTFAEVDRLSRLAAAAYRRRLGVGRGTVVMHVLRNCPEFVISFLAASRLGAAVTMANPFYHHKEILRQVEAASPTVIITEACAVPLVAELAKERTGIQVVTIDERFEGYAHFSELVGEDQDGGEVPEVVEGFDPDDVVALPFSSGTVGLPKGVVLTHRSLSTSVAQQVDGENPNIYMHEGDVMLALLPMFHIYCLSTIMMCGLRVGAAMLVMKKFDMEKMLELVERHRVTILPLVPPTVLALANSNEVAKHDLSTVRMVVCGGAPMGKDTEEAFLAKMPPGTILGQGYGMTEAGPVLSMCLAFAKQPFPVKSGACGTVVRNAELKIVDPTSGVTQGRNKTGEICIRGEQIMKGYLNDLESTKNTIDQDGWLHTGDIGYVDDDDEVFIVDRLKELIKYNGFQVAPAELEALLVTHPLVADAAVVGLREERHGELPVAFAVKANGAEVCEEDIKKFVSDEVIFYKKIHHVFFVNAIPKAPSGKILRKELRAKLETMSF